MENEERMVKCRRLKEKTNVNVELPRANEPPIQVAIIPHSPASISINNSKILCRR
jgi:hypothetical protein